MGLGKIVRNAIAIADKITGGSDGLQVTIQINRWIDDDDFNKPEYASAIDVEALVEEKQRFVTISTGEEVWQKAIITILRPLVSNGASGRNEPIDLRDTITLPSGYTGPIKDIVGEIDRSTEKPYMLTVVLG